MNRVNRLIKHDLISDDAANEINEIMLRELDNDMQENEIDTDTLALQPDEEKVSESQGYEREILDGACESGICPSR